MPALVLVLGAVLVIGFIRHKPKDDPARRRAREEIARYVAAYPIWRAWTDGTSCPTRGELDALVPDAPTVDPWGERYVVTCDGMTSRGPDRRLQTSDDLHAAF